MSRAIETIMELAGCSEDDAQRAYAETNDVEDAIEKLLPPLKNAARKYYDCIKPVRNYTEEEKQIRILRESLKKMDEEHAKRSISSNQPASVAQVEQSTPHEETVPQSNCYQECQIPSLQLEAQKPETACPLPSECSYGSPLSGQTSHGSARLYDRYYQDLD